MRSSTLLALALPVIAAFPLDEAASSSKHMNKKRVEPTKGGRKWTQWDGGADAMDGSRWAHPQSHQDGSAWAKEGWPQVAKDSGDWSRWDEDEDAMDGSRWGKTSGRVGSKSPRPPMPPPQGPRTQGPRPPAPQPPAPDMQPPRPDPAGASGGPWPGSPLGPLGRPFDAQQPDESLTFGDGGGDTGHENNDQNGPDVFFDSFGDGGKPDDDEPTPAPQSPQQPPAPAPATGGVPSARAEAALAQVNELRRQHGSPDMVYDMTVEAGAQLWADKCASDGAMSHSKTDSENIWQGRGPQYTEDRIMSMAITSWYEEEPLYEAKIGYREPTTTQRDMAFGPKATKDDMWGHFTQLVWISSTRLGCAQSAGTDTAGNRYVVCRFKEGGNMPGAYVENVKPKGSPT